MFNINGKLRYVKQDLLLFLHECIRVRHKWISKGEKSGSFSMSTKKFRCLCKAYLNYLNTVKSADLSSARLHVRLSAFRLPTQTQLVRKETCWHAMLFLDLSVVVKLRMRKIKFFIQIGIRGSVWSWSSKMVIDLVHIDNELFHLDMCLRGIQRFVLKLIVHISTKDQSPNRFTSTCIYHLRR